jgi:excisionase family DNA binding protein
MSFMRQVPELMNLQTAADALSVSRATLHRWLDAGKIQTIRYPDSNRRLITADEVDRIIKLGMEKHVPSYDTCIEINVKGERCQNRPMDDLEVCGAHSQQRVERGAQSATT